MLLKVIFQVQSAGILFAPFFFDVLSILEQIQLFWPEIIACTNWPKIHCDPVIGLNEESGDNWIDETDWTDVESEDTPNQASKAKKSYSRDSKKLAKIQKIKESIQDLNLRNNLDEIISNGQGNRLVS